VAQVSQLVLSLFPGIGLLDMAFEEEGFTVVRGPDLLWGGDVRRFHPPSGKFDGVIGGPPCQAHSRFRYLVAATGRKVAEDLIPEFVRVVERVGPGWFLMENAPDSPEPDPRGYHVHRFLLNNRWLGEDQNRERAFSFGATPQLRMRAQDLRRFIDYAPLDSGRWVGAVLASGGRKPGTEGARGRRPGREYGYATKAAYAAALSAQGLPADFLDGDPFTLKGKFRMVGNGVPLPMGRAIARAVKAALGIDQEVSA
jgi:DNA (cytosine-5)-methyltransferase 1